MKTLPIPNKKDLERDYDKLRTQSAVAKKYGVSDTTIHKWFLIRKVEII